MRVECYNYRSRCETIRFRRRWCCFNRREPHASRRPASILKLLSIPEPPSVAPAWQSHPPLVKICGIRSKDEALAVAASGADLLELMFVKKSNGVIDITARKKFLKQCATPVCCVLMSHGSQAKPTSSIFSTQVLCQLA